MPIVKALFLAVAMLVVSAELVAAQTVYTFQQVGNSPQYRFLINGNVFRTLNFAGNNDPVQELEIDRRTLRRFGVTGNIQPQANRDLQNNAYLEGSALRVSLSREFIDGTLDIAPPPVPRATFDFRRQSESRFDLFINDIRFRTVNFNNDDEQFISLNKIQLRNRFGIALEDQLHVLQRTFGTNIREFNNRFVVGIEEERAAGENALFFFEEVAFDDFRLYINGRNDNAIGLPVQGIIGGTGPAIFEISADALAARFGLTGDIYDIFDLDRGDNDSELENGIRITDLGNGIFRFEVARALFLNGGSREFEDNVFTVVRRFVSPS